MPLQRRICTYRDWLIGRSSDNMEQKRYAVHFAFRANLNAIIVFEIIWVDVGHNIMTVNQKLKRLIHDLLKTLAAIVSVTDRAGLIPPVRKLSVSTVIVILFLLNKLIPDLGVNPTCQTGEIE